MHGGLNRVRPCSLVQLPFCSIGGQPSKLQQAVLPDGNRHFSTTVFSWMGSRLGSIGYDLTADLSFE
jgi:hypothetical protein